MIRVPNGALETGIRTDSLENVGLSSASIPVLEKLIEIVRKVFHQDINKN